MNIQVEVGDLSQLQTLVEAVEHGTDVTVTRNGKAVVRMVRAEPVHTFDREAAASAMREITAIGQRLTLGKDLTIRELIDHGRKY